MVKSKCSWQGGCLQLLLPPPPPRLPHPTATSTAPASAGAASPAPADTARCYNCSSLSLCFLDVVVVNIGFRPPMSLLVVSSYHWYSKPCFSTLSSFSSFPVLLTLRATFPVLESFGKKHGNPSPWLDILQALIEMVPNTQSPKALNRK